MLIRTLCGFSDSERIKVEVDRITSPHLDTKNFGGIQICVCVCVRVRVCLYDIHTYLHEFKNENHICFLMLKTIHLTFPNRPLFLYSTCPGMNFFLLKTSWKCLVPVRKVEDTSKKIISFHKLNHCSLFISGRL